MQFPRIAACGRALMSAALCLWIAGAAAPAAAQDFSAAAIVNDRLISNYDVDQRARFLAAATQGATLDAMREPALKSLIDDALRMSAAQNAGVKVSEAEFQAGLSEIAAQNGSTADELMAYFQSRGVGRETIEAQVRAEVAWRLVVLQRYGPRVAVSEEEIDSAVAQSANAGAAAEAVYDLKQVVVAVGRDAPADQANAAFAEAQKVQAAMGSCAAADALKAQYGGVSGDIPNITLAAMPAPVREAVAPLSVGQVTAPIRSNDGFHVIIVCDRKTSSAPAVGREAARLRLLDKKLSRYSRNMMQDLRRSAVVERR